MTSLGTYDATVSETDLDRYHDCVRSLTGATALPEWRTQLRGEGRWVSYRLRDAVDPMTVVGLQRLVRDAGFLPFGASSGMCRYRNLAAIFQYLISLLVSENNGTALTIVTSKSALKGRTHRPMLALLNRRRSSTWRLTKS
jgi:hypothetical protein